MNQIKLVDTANEAGVRRFVPAQFGSDPMSNAALLRLPLLGAEKAVITSLEEREDQISWTGIENGPFFDYVSGLCFLARQG
ncbi:hypothetical protein LTR56_027184 [Elasticomyces elasticus]|nr:hypothetical protein LTR56_027184 [Elasticomyces elasticus]KAK3615902.1 hypothetical protein LTR22_027251 [Elasticomyces elasticus]KAK4898563.1 hypothetical protein LTR49_027784 [Elasticomyces elasticus]